jgi:hypothetical protein
MRTQPTSAREPPSRCTAPEPAKSKEMPNVIYHCIVDANRGTIPNMLNKNPLQRGQGQILSLLLNTFLKNIKIIDKNLFSAEK